MQKPNSFEAVGVNAIKLKESIYCCEFIKILTPRETNITSRKHVAYFSASGVTATVAQTLAGAILVQISLRLHPSATPLITAFLVPAVFFSVPKNKPCKRITPTAASRLGKQPNKATLRSDLDASCG